MKVWPIQDRYTKIKPIQDHSTEELSTWDRKFKVSGLDSFFGN